MQGQGGARPPFPFPGVPGMPMMMPPFGKRVSQLSVLKCCALLSPLCPIVFARLGGQQGMMGMGFPPRLGQNPMQGMMQQALGNVMRPQMPLLPMGLIANVKRAAAAGNACRA